MFGYKEHPLIQPSRQHFGPGLESQTTLRDINAMRTMYLYLLLVLLICQHAAAEKEPGISNEESVIDEITVIGARELRTLRIEIARAEDARKHEK